MDTVNRSLHSIWLLIGRMARSCKLMFVSRMRPKDAFYLQTSKVGEIFFTDQSSLDTIHVLRT